MRENSTERKSFTKSRLVKELSWTCALPQTKVKAVLESLVAVARREARNTFVIPGVCKLEVVRRKPRKVRNPRTGETFMLPERDALRITAPRSLKLACVKPVEQPEVAVPTPATPEQPIDPNALISFRCPRCNQEVEATGDMVGFETECPTCGNPITVPAQSEPGTLHAAAPADEPPVLRTPVVSSQEAESLSPEKLKGLTIRIDVDSLGLGGAQKAAEDPPPEMMVSFVSHSGIGVFGLHPCGI